MDLESIMGYAFNSPYRNSPYLDIKTPKGLITMENTPVDLLGIDNLGNTKKMKAGRKNPYKFDGDVVREIPMSNPYQAGGLTQKQMFDYIFDDEPKEDEPQKVQLPTAPSTEEVEMPQEQAPDDQYDMAMGIAMGDFGNPYKSSRRNPPPDSGNPYSGEILSSGQFGNQNVGEFGKQIYGQLTQDLGYAPVANSIYRSPKQQNELIAKGVGVKNSYHLTGDAIDLKPEDWHRLSNENQQYYRMNYDVVYHNNHYHIEPK